MVLPFERRNVVPKFKRSEHFSLTIFHVSGDQWIRSQQKDSNAGASYAADEFPSNGNVRLSQNVFNNKQSDDYTTTGIADRSRQHGENYGSGQQTAGGQLYRAAQNGGASVGLQSAGLAGETIEKMIEKIAAIQEIAGRAQHFDGAAIAVDKDAIKLSDREFVTFGEATMKRLEDGRLEYAYVNVERDVVMAQYAFDRVETVGSFKSNVQGAKAGRFDVVMNQMTGNVSTGLNGDGQKAAEPARSRFAEATIVTADGAETRAFDGALKHRYLGVLERAVSAEVARSVGRGPIAQMKREMRDPMPFRGAKLFDMSWTEDDVSMQMSGIGFAKTAGATHLTAVSLYRVSDNVYGTRCLFAFNDLEWISPLTVESAGRNKMTMRAAHVKVDGINVHVTVLKSRQPGDGQQQPCGQINTHVEVAGLRYDFDETVPSEFLGKIQDKLQRFIEHSLEYNVQQSLKQDLCNINKY